MGDRPRGGWAVRRHSVRLGAVAATVSLLGVLVASPADAQPTGGVRVVHGLLGVVADVYLDEALVIQAFRPQHSTDLIAVTEGTHRIDARPVGSPASSPPLLSGNFDVAEDEQISAMLHLSVAGEPMFSNFVDDTSPVPAGQTRVTVRHTAAAPAIDVLLDAEPVARALPSLSQVASQLAAGTYEISVTQAGTPQVLAPPADVPLREGTANEMYLVGNQADGSLVWIAVQVSGLQTAPAQVSTGNSGLVAPGSSGPGRDVLALVIGACAVGALALVGRRRARAA
jgi:hypothetical protein